MSQAKAGVVPWNKGKKSSRPRRKCAYCGEIFEDKWYSGSQYCCLEHSNKATKVKERILLTCKECGKKRTQECHRRLRIIAAMNARMPPWERQRSEEAKIKKDMRILQKRI